MALRIGDLAARTATTAPTIRYYEEIGLMPRPERRGGGQRAYGDDDVRRLTFIRRCREFGFPIGQVRALAALVEDRGRNCIEARDLARDHLARVRAKLAELEALERTMTALVADCEARCLGGPGPDCVVLEDLARPAPVRPDPGSGRGSAP